ncbi:uncharacterized protein SPPG_04730 [Spizellomyces punctatus DAOM BR117]|uniref:Uncharacterized protein n=1 Tax=Spizellomyces punctatus (strain DAOM BR117) TaxID=645134 RepID=A0A0L0HH55_SPIPD|nr:uncharacterized protein SPPG_04730 [Spizellomyces punctatus DAOM BR117]KND00407.1 hypothetical protein SPPG_04730 [Spizellomyces punctatus DAOM BR117]|eukprot:XP_016608446.1 hypothetical protein SPPG_04730 [Spizellomyces punctatus DAOM BR117]
MFGNEDLHPLWRSVRDFEEQLDATLNVDLSSDVGSIIHQVENQRLVSTRSALENKNKTFSSQNGSLPARAPLPAQSFTPRPRLKKRNQVSFKELELEPKKNIDRLEATVESLHKQIKHLLTSEGLPDPTTRQHEKPYASSLVTHDIACDAELISQRMDGMCIELDALQREVKELLESNDHNPRDVAPYSIPYPEVHDRLKTYIEAEMDMALRQHERDFKHMLDDYLSELRLTLKQSASDGGGAKGSAHGGRSLPRSSRPGHRHISGNSWPPSEIVDMDQLLQTLKSKLKSERKSIHRSATPQREQSNCPPSTRPKSYRAAYAYTKPTLASTLKNKTSKES